MKEMGETRVQNTFLLQYSPLDVDILMSQNITLQHIYCLLFDILFSPSAFFPIWTRNWIQ